MDRIVGQSHASSEITLMSLTRSARLLGSGDAARAGLCSISFESTAALLATETDGFAQLQIADGSRCRRVAHASRPRFRCTH